MKILNLGDRMNRNLILGIIGYGLVVLLTSFIFIINDELATGAYAFGILSGSSITSSSMLLIYYWKEKKNKMVG